jgi:hypothetical protein
MKDRIAGEHEHACTSMFSSGFPSDISIDWSLIRAKLQGHTYRIGSGIINTRDTRNIFNSREELEIY